MLKNPVSRKRTTQAAVRRPRRPSPHTTVIASKCALPQTRQHPLFGTVHTKEIDDAGVEFFPLLAPPDFKVSAVFQGDDSYTGAIKAKAEGMDMTIELSGKKLGTCDDPK